MNSKHRHILTFISRIRESHPEMVNVYTQGSCMNFYWILKSIWPESRCYYNNNHVITRIGNKFYDITGEVSCEGYEPIMEMCDKKRLKRTVSQMRRAFL